MSLPCIFCKRMHLQYIEAFLVWGRFRKRNLKHAKECSIQQRRGFACGVCRWKRRFGCSRNSAVSAARFESGFRERDGQGQHWRGPHSHGGFLKMIVCESGGHANGLTYFIFRFLRRPQTLLGLCPKPQPHLRWRRRGRRLKPNHLTLWRSVGSAPRRQG